LTDLFKGEEIVLTNDTLSTIKNRRSTRTFRSEQIKADELKAVLEAGSAAPSANTQARHFTVIQNPGLLSWLNQEAKEQAKQFEPLQELANSEHFHIFYDAPTVVLVSAEESGIALESDCAAATENMLLAAESIGLGSCWIGFVLVLFASPNANDYGKRLGIPDRYTPYAAAAFGYKTGEAVNTPPRRGSLINYQK